MSSRKLSSRSSSERGRQLRPRLTEASARQDLRLARRNLRDALRYYKIARHHALQMGIEVGPAPGGFADIDKIEVHCIGAHVHLKLNGQTDPDCGHLVVDIINGSVRHLRGYDEHHGWQNFAHKHDDS